MPSQLGPYKLLRTLGTGANSKVKLGEHSENGQKYAVKILKKNDPRLDQEFLKLVMTEVQTMSGLSHPNIVNMVDYAPEAFVEKSNGAKNPVICIVLELATGGELFDYVATGGAYNERISRFYFRQLIDGLNYVHNKGITHRDLKPENLLYDEKFNLKIADFGFAAPITGRDGSGYCRTKLGTESYMAPEIHAKRPYSGASVDIFAAAIILFIMFTQHPPFTRAEPTDPFYRLLCANRADLFWKAHSKNKPGNMDFFPESFRNLITAMLQFDPAARPTMADIISHPWVQSDNVATLEEIHADFAKRKEAIDHENEIKRQEKEAQRQAQLLAANGVSRRQFRTVGVHRGDDDENVHKGDGDEETPFIEKYIPGIKSNGQFFSSLLPSEILGEISQYLEDKKCKFTVDTKKYKLKASVKTLDNLDDEEMGSGDEGEEAKDKDEDSIQLSVKILEVENKKKYCVEFNRIEGDSLIYYQMIQKIRDDLADLANA